MLLKEVAMVQVRRRFYKRIWFWSVVILFVAAAAVGGWFYFDNVTKYERKAAEYDLSQLKEVESASVVYDRYGNVFGKLFIQNREQIPLERVSQNIIDAVISAEDNRFYDHHGVDFMGIVRAAFKNTQAGRIRQGASTITQQLARNAFDLRDRTYDRKLLEMFLAMRIEKTFPKKQILEFYLNRVYFGGGLYGAEAAARGYFGKSAKDVTPGEAAMLAGLLKSPNNLSPWRNLQAATEERNFVLGRMVENGKISGKEARQLEQEPLVVRPRSSALLQSYALDFVRQQVQGELGFEAVRSEGYKIYTTLDPVLQETAEASLRRELAKAEARGGFRSQTYDEYVDLLKNAKEGQTQVPLPEYLQGAALTVDNHTGGILALVGGRDFGHSEFNRALQSRRPPGTAFTPLVVAAALEKGVFPGALFEDSPLDNRQVMIGGTTGILGEWGVERPDNRYEGPIPLRRIVALSKNAATVRIGVEAGLDKVIDLAKRAGIGDELRPFPATFLGSSEVTLASLVQAYTIFPGGGSRPDRLSIVTRVETADGREVYRTETSRKPVLDPGIAYEVHSYLTEALQTGTGEKARQNYRLGQFPAAGKTGTAYNFTDAWFVGYDSAITCGVWAGFDKPQSIYRGAFGNQIALPVWTDIMNASLEKNPAREVGRPLNLKRVEVCLSSGLPAVPQCLTTSGPDNGGPPKKGTFVEFAMPNQIPKEHCWVHGDDTRSFVRLLRSQDAPRATSTVDQAQLNPVYLQSPTVVGDDPYGSVKPRAQLAGAQASLTPAPRALPVEKPAPEVRRAEPVGPLDRQQSPPPMDLPPPDPVDLNNDPTNI
jgi:membrane peptidoglycan carboxypeptidase